jgi:Flp pilus assembly CpaE family ATPase
MRLTSFVKETEYRVDMHVVANKVSARDKPEVSQKEFARGIGMPVNFVLPWDSKAVSDSAKAGRAITDAVSKSALSRAIISTALSLSRAKEISGGKKSFWDRLKLGK